MLSLLLCHCRYWKHHFIPAPAAGLHLWSLGHMILTVSPSSLCTRSGPPSYLHSQMQGRPRNWHTCSAPWGHTGCFCGRQSLGGNISSASLFTHSFSHSFIHYLRSTYCISEIRLENGKATRELQASPTDIWNVKQRPKLQGVMHITETTALDRKWA